MQSKPFDDPWDTDAVGNEDRFVLIRGIDHSNINDFARLRTTWKPGLGRSYRFTPGERMASYLVLDQGEPIAFLQGNHDFSNWDITPDFRGREESDCASFITGMFVFPERRSEGIGHRLLTHFILDAGEAGSDVVILDAEKGDDELRRVRFFEDHGFQWLTPQFPQYEPLMARHLKL